LNKARAPTNPGRLLDRHLAGFDGQSALVAIVDDFEEIG
jgi:hypothetical protein